MKSAPVTPIDFLSSFSGAEVALLTDYGSQAHFTGDCADSLCCLRGLHATSHDDIRTVKLRTIRVQVWGYIVADFSTRVWDYFELRSELEKGLPPLTVTDDPAEIRRAIRALAKRIRVARAGAKQGDIFTPTISVEFRKALILEMNANTWAAIMDDNPGEFSNQINGTYPEGKPLSTVPPNILAALPRLPDDIQYRFLGRHLILLDTRANRDPRPHPLRDPVQRLR